MNVKIKKSISRKINTAQYENVVISCDLEIECEVKNEEDLIRCQNEVNEKLIKDYKNTEIVILNELSLEEKKAFLETSASSVKKKVNFSEDIESEIFG